MTINSVVLFPRDLDREWLEEREQLVRAAQARAIRWVRSAPWDWESGDFEELDAIAGRVERGEVTIPEE